jgi:hypothetical protein
VSRSQEAQRQRTQNNPLVLGSFDTTSLKYLKGRLGPLNQLVGRADTSQQSNGGFGGGTYNHWFQVNLKSPAWIIVVKGGARPEYIQTSIYDLNKNPIEGRGVFQADSISMPNGTTPFYPYLGTSLAAFSDLYNVFDNTRLDRGDERYYPLTVGSYLLCISTTRNELLDYEVGLVIEFPDTEFLFALEDTSELGLLLSEEINESFVILEPGSDEFVNSVHDHSLGEWRTYWEDTHQDTDKFPEIFAPLTNRV